MAQSMSELNNGLVQDLRAVEPDTWFVGISRPALSGAVTRKEIRY